MQETINVTKKMKVNARSSSVALKTMSGEQFDCDAVWVEENVVDEEGTNRPCAYFRDTSGKIYGTISPTVIDNVNDFVEAINEEGAITLRVNPRTSNSGREYLTLEWL